MPTTILIRHAQASYGAVDYDVLSEAGHWQSALLDSELAARSIAPAVAITGPARRHRDTARLCERALAGVPLVEDARWAEYDTDSVLARHGGMSGAIGGAQRAPISSHQFQVVLDAALEDWLNGCHDESPGGQAWPDYLEQVFRALKDLADQLERGQTAIVFTSAGAIAAACCAVLELGAASFVALNRVQVNTGITKIVHGQRGMSLVTFNEHGHLEEADRFLVTSR